MAREPYVAYGCGSCTRASLGLGEYVGLESSTEQKCWQEVGTADQACTSSCKATLSLVAYESGPTTYGPALPRSIAGQFDVICQWLGLQIACLSGDVLNT